MSRRQILTADEHARLFGMPSDPETLIRHCTLSPADLDWLAGRRGAANQLGRRSSSASCVIRASACAWRRTRPESRWPARARQLDVPAAAWADYARRTRRAVSTPCFGPPARVAHLHARRPAVRPIAGRGRGMGRGPGRADCVRRSWPGCGEARIIPSSPRMIERLGLAGRARARKRAAATLVDNLTPGQLERIDALLTNDPQRSSRIQSARHPGSRGGVEPRRRARPARSCPGDRSRSRARHHHP